MERRSRRISLAALVCLALFAAIPARAANYDRTYQIIATVYDIGAYTDAVDALLQQAEGRGVFGGKGSTAAKRAQDRALTRLSLLRERDVVLRMTSDKVAAEATDQQIDALIRIAGSSDPAIDPAPVQPTVALIKARFNDAAWYQMAHTARGNSEFLCDKNNQRYCQ